MNTKFFFSVLILVCGVLFSSCSAPVNLSGNYSTLSIKIPQINNDSILPSIPKDMYEIKKVIPLDVPTDCFVKFNRPKYCENRIYLLNSTRSSVLVFDSLGNFVHKIGTKGHAKNEIIDEITTYDVDSSDLSVHIFDRNGRKILIFDRDGKYIKTINLRDVLPSYLVLTNNKMYIASCNVMSSKDGYTQLIQMDEDGLIQKVFFEDRSTNNITCEGSNIYPLSSDRKGNISYLSALSDSIIVISQDSVKEVIKLDFDDGYLSESVIAQEKESGEISDESDDKIRYVKRAFVTDSVVAVEFLGKSNNVVNNYNFLYNRKLKKSCLINGNILLQNLIGKVCGIHNDEVTVLVTEDDIEQLETVYGIMSKQSGDHCPYKSFLDFCSDSFNNVSIDVISNKNQLPIILKIKIKWEK